MAINEYYIDATSGSDTTGDGSSGTPWATLYYAFANSSFGSEGARFWLFGTDVLAAVLPTGTGGPGYSSAYNPILIQGWDKDGSGATYPGTIDSSIPCATHQGFMASSISNVGVSLRDLELVNTIVWLGGYTLMDNCYLRATSSSVFSKFSLSYGSVVHNCRIEPAGANCIVINSQVDSCWFDDSYYDVSGPYDTAPVLLTYRDRITRNIFYCTGDNVVISCGDSYVGHNSILCVDGTAANSAIVTGAASAYTPMLVNNLVEGFGGQKAFEIQDNRSVNILAGNAAYNNGTDYDITSTWSHPTYGSGAMLVRINEDNESLASSPFAKIGALSYSNRLSYFSPNNVGNVQGGAYSGQGKLDKGAVQGSSGGSLTDILFLAAEDKIKTSNLDGSNLTDLVTGSGNARDIDIDLVNNHLYWMEISDGAGTENAIYRVDVNGSNKTKIADVDKSLGLKLDIANEHIYYGTATNVTDSIRRMDFDGTNDTSLVTSPKRVNRVALDLDSSHIYWTGHATSLDGALYRCDLDGANLTIIVDDTTQTDMRNVRGLALDLINSKVYVSTTGELIQMNLDGSSFTDIGDVTDGNDIMLYPVLGRIFVADPGQDSVYTFNFDGSNRQLLFPASTANFTGVVSASDSGGSGGNGGGGGGGSDMLVHPGTSGGMRG